MTGGEYALVAAVIILAAVMVFTFGPGAAAGSQGGGSGSGGSSPNSPNMYVSPVNLATPNTAVTTVTTDVFSPTGAKVKASLAANTAFNIGATGKYRLFTSNTSAYFSTESYVQGDGTNNPVYASPAMAAVGTPTVSVYNPNSYTLNSNSAQTAVGANGNPTWHIVVAPAANVYITNPKPTVMGSPVNPTVEFTLKYPVPAEWLYADSSQTFMETAAGANSCTSTGIAAPADSGGAQMAFQCPMANGGTGSAGIDFYLTTKAVSGGAAAQNLTLGLYPMDIYANTDTGITGFGVTDNQGTLLHPAVNTTIYVS